MQHVQPHWHGNLWLAPDYCLIAGQAGHTGSHAHYPHQVLIARTGEVEAIIDGKVERGPVLLIESGREHAILTGEQSLISLYAEPLAFELPSLREVCAGSAAEAEQLIAALSRLPRRTLQPRLAKAVQRIRQLDAEALPAAELASAAALSLSQLERLFSGELGVSVRRLVLWQRLRLALKLALSGHSLTSAAATAGFADSAHLSRTIRRHFGIRGDHTLRHLDLRVIG
ncbi:helix-turn-helix domain-containing protein [Pseudomonas wadenswilerensis]